MNSGLPETGNIDIQARNLDDVLKVTGLANVRTIDAIEFIGNAVDHAWSARQADILRYLAGVAASVKRTKVIDSDAA